MLIAAGLLVAGVALLSVPLLVIQVDTGGRLTSDPADVSQHQVALVLGAGLTARGTPTWFLADRLDAAIRLYRMGKEAVWDADVTNPSPRYLGAHEQLHLQPATAGAG
jgi:vancomycin permeability regulator SanA